MSRTTTTTKSASKSRLDLSNFFDPLSILYDLAPCIKKRLLKVNRVKRLDVPSKEAISPL